MNEYKNKFKELYTSISLSSTRFDGTLLAEKFIFMAVEANFLDG
jgi:hypothetical protein